MESKYGGEMDAMSTWVCAPDAFNGKCEYRFHLELRTPNVLVNGGLAQTGNTPRHFRPVRST